MTSGFVGRRLVPALWFGFLAPALALAEDGGPSEGVVLLGNVALSDFPGNPQEAEDVWGYVSPSGREYALLGMYDQTAFIEVTDPSAPVVLHEEPRSPSSWSDLAVYGEYAFMVSDGTGTGFNVFDLSDIDNGNVSFVTSYNGPTSDRFFIAHNVYVNEASGFAYVVGGSPGLVGMRVIDVADPTQPVQVKNWGVQGIHDIYVKTYETGVYAGREIAFLAAENNGVWIVDVTDKSNFLVLAPNLSYETVTYCHQLWPSEDDRYLFVNDELDERDNPDVTTTTTYVFNIEDLENPVYIGSFTNGLSSIDHNLMVRGSFVYEANYHSGLRVYDITRLDEGVETVSEIAYYDTYPGDDGLDFDGAWGVYTQLPSRNVLVSDINRGLFIFDVVAAVEYTYAWFEDEVASDPAVTDGVSWVTRDGGDGLYVSNRDAASKYIVPDDDTGDFNMVSDDDLTRAGDGRSSLWIDVDNDGDLDAYLTASSAPNSLVRNDGDGVFTDVTVPPLDDVGAARGVGAADYDGDGDLDIYLVNQSSPNRLFRNDGDGVWVDVAEPLGVIGPNSSTGVAWGDYDADGDPDLVVTSRASQNSLFRNDGGVFTGVSITGIPWRSETMGAAWGDVDGDLDLDLFITNIDREDALYRNDGADTFVEVTADWDLPTEFGQSVGTTWGDYNRDGTLDLFVTQLDGGLRLFENDGNSFIERSQLNFGDQVGVNATGVATSDYDGDGDLDVYAGNAAGANRLYRNRGGNSNAWLSVDLVGADPNRFGIGARVEVFDGARWQVREISAGLGYLSQEPAVAFFGLPGGQADSVRVRWPMGAVTDSLLVGVNRRLTVFEPGVTPTQDDPHEPPPFTVMGFALYPNAPNPFNPSTRIPYHLGERATVWLSVHDVAGRRVRVLIAGVSQREGRWIARWDGRDDAGRPVASGVYRYRLRAGAYDMSRTMTLLK